MGHEPDPPLILTAENERKERPVTTYVPPSDSESAGGGVWLGGQLGDPPYKAEIGDRWWPEGDQHCYLLTEAGWVVDLDAERMLWTLSSPDDA